MVMHMVYSGPQRHFFQHITFVLTSWRLSDAVLGSSTETGSYGYVAGKCLTLLHVGILQLVICINVPLLWPSCATSFKLLYTVPLFSGYNVIFNGP